MKYTPQSIGGMGLAALAGLMMMAASPALSQPASSPSQGAPSQAAPSQATPGNPGTPSDQASPSYQNGTGSMQGGAMENTGKMNSSMSSAKTESLSKVAHAKTTLASAQVQDSSGQQVGQVSSVHTTRSGHATKVDITLSSSNGSGQPKTVSVSASKLRYDKDNNTLIANTTATDLQAMPATTSSGM